MIYNITNIDCFRIDFDSYEQLITFYRTIKLETYKQLHIYTETHHIVPRHMGGSNLQDNLIELPWMMHVLAHFLLAKHFEKLDSQIAIKNYYAVRMIIGQDKVANNLENYEDVKKQTILQAIELETKNRLNCKRIYINRDGKTIQVFEDAFDVYEKQGWKKGRVFRNGKGKVWVHDDKQSYQIKKEELESYLKRGFQKGMFKTESMKAYDRGKSLPKTKGFKWVYKNDKRLLIKPSEVPTYLQDGWKLGSNQKPMLGKTYTPSEAQRKAISERLKGVVWWNNGIINIKSKECPEGFVRGKLHESKEC